MIQAITNTGDVLMEFLDDTDLDYMQNAIEELFPELSEDEYCFIDK